MDSKILYVRAQRCCIFGVSIFKTVYIECCPLVHQYNISQQTGYTIQYKETVDNQLIKIQETDNLRRLVEV
jgi:hypothetical protein